MYQPCPTCGHDVADRDVECSVCGEELAPTSARAATPAPSPPVGRREPVASEPVLTDQDDWLDDEDFDVSAFEPILPLNEVPVAARAAPRRSLQTAPLVAVLAVIAVIGGGFWLRSTHPGHPRSGVSAAAVTRPATTAIDDDTAVEQTDSSDNSYDDGSGNVDGNVDGNADGDVGYDSQTTADSSFGTDDDETATPTVTGDAEQAAAESLEEQRAADLQRTTFNNRWVAQLSSKVPGITDPYQTATDGSNIFEASDILTQFRQFQDRPELGDVFLLKSTDFGKHQTYDGEAMWVVFADDDFASSQAVHAWCRMTFEQSGPALDDTCTPRRLKH
jgi:hypothetical protein